MHNAKLRFWGLTVAVLTSLLSVDAQASNLTRTSAFTYDGTGLLVREVVEPGSSDLCVVTNYIYDAYGNKTDSAVRNCNGSALVGMNEAGTPTGTAVFSARSSNVGYGTRGQFAISGTNALTQTSSSSYLAPYGALTSTTDPNGITASWAYDTLGRKTLEIRPDGTRTKWDYLYCNGFNGGTLACPSYAVYAIQSTPLATDGITANGPWAKTYYDSLDRPVRTEALGFDGSSIIRKDTVYDSLGRISQTSRPYYSTQSPVWTAYTYDALGRNLSIIQPDVGTTTTQYNGLVTSVTNPLNQTATSTRNSQSQVISIKDAAGKMLNYQYDPFGNLTKTIDPLGNVVVTTFDLRGRKIQMVDPDLGAWTYSYNALGELLQQTDAKAQVTSLVYDQLGRTTHRNEPDMVSNWYYDKYKDGSACGKGIGKLCQSESDNGYGRTINYDNLGRPVGATTMIDAVYTTGAIFDAQGRLATQTYPSGLTVKYVYTSLGFLKEVRDNSTNALYWTANVLDAEGHLQQQTYGNSVVTQQAYQNTTGRLTQILAGAGNAVQNLSYQYDSIGNVSSRSDTNQTLNETFLYDTLNRLTSATVNSSGAGTVTTTYGYNDIGNITSRSNLGAYTYNASGGSSVRPHAVNAVAIAGWGNRQYSYDANGNLTAEVQYDAANNVVAAKGRTETYTSYNMVASLNTPQGDAPPIPYFTYSCKKLDTCTFDASGSLDDHGIVSYEWSFGQTGAKVTRSQPNLTYGNSSATLTVTDTLGQKRTASAAFYVKDPGVVCTILWVDGVCALTTGSSGTKPTTAPSPPPVSITFQYNAEHQRIRQIAPSGTTIYLNPDSSGGLLFEKEIKADGTIESRNYITAGGQVVAMVKQIGATSQTMYFHRDSLGSTTTVTDASGAVVERMAYEPFGKRRQPSGQLADSYPVLTGVNTDRGFTNHEHIDEVGLINMNGRVYDPTIGRFISADPFIENAASLQAYNRYSYVSNSPLNATDPTGYWSLGKWLKSTAVFDWSFGSGVMTPRVAFTYVRNQPFQSQIDRFVMNNQYAYAAGEIAASAFTSGCGGCGGAAWAAYYSYQSTGSVHTAMRIGAITYATSWAFSGAGDIENAGLRYAAHAAIGCASAAATGGNCGQGAASAFTGVLATDYFGANLVVTSVVGGTTSVITGGKFGNGAVTAAFGYLFNSLLHPSSSDTSMVAGIRNAILRGDAEELRVLLGNAGSDLSGEELAIAQRALAGMEGVSADNASLLAQRYGLDWANKVNKVFNGMHQGPIGDALVSRFGSPAEAMIQVQRSLEVAKPSTGLFGNSFSTSVSVQGITVQVRGRVIEGIYRIGTIEKW